MRTDLCRQNCPCLNPGIFKDRGVLFNPYPLNAECRMVPSGKLTWQWKMDQLKMYSLLKMVIFHCHVSLLEGIFYENHLGSFFPGGGGKCKVYIYQSHWASGFGVVFFFWWYCFYPLPPRMPMVNEGLYLGIPERKYVKVMLVVTGILGGGSDP